MRYIFLITFISLLACNDNGETQSDPVDTGSKDSVVRLPETNNQYATYDVSPMDMVYFPLDFPKMKMADPSLGDPLIRVIYSRPKKAGRAIFGGLQKYGETWRLGANESTELQLFKDATIKDKKIPAGRYIMYCVPDSTQWTIVLNSNTDSWGLQHDKKKDVARFNIKTEQAPNAFELFTMGFEKTDTGANLVMAWDNVLARLPISW